MVGEVSLARLAAIDPLGVDERVVYEAHGCGRVVRVEISGPVDAVELCRRRGE